MAEPVLITGCASGDFQSLDGVFLARLQPLRDGTLDAPAPTAIIIFHNNDIREIILQRTCHALRCAVRNAEFLRDFLKTDAQTPRGGELGEAQKIVGLRSEEHTSEIQSLLRISYAGFCVKKKKTYYT